MARPRFRDDPARAELLALYARVDALTRGHVCEGTTDCCRFGITGREPYPTAVELAEVSHAIRARGSPVPARRALPLADRTCPLLSDLGRCTIYASRPFGCRTFFCDRTEARLPKAEIQRLGREIADLSARYAPRDPRPRPLTRALSLLR